jgi:hypothetical protein
MKKLTRTDANKIFKLVQNMEDLHWTNMRSLENTVVKALGSQYELAVVDGNIVGIGEVTSRGHKLIFHR